MNPIKVTRKTTESKMMVVLDFSPLKNDYRSKIKTPIPFLNHMIEHVAWRGGFNIETECSLAEFTLTHVICEDLGIALGKACAEYIKRADGAWGFGDAIGIIDEAKVQTAISFEGRAYFDMDCHGVTMSKEAEKMDTEDLVTFLEGFAQGASCTLHVDVFKGINAHHIWEAVFRSFGTSLNNAFKIGESRKGMTAGVAGKIEWIVE